MEDGEVGVINIIFFQLLVHPVAVDGGWGSWSDSGKCTRSCGTGTQLRTRICDSPKADHGGLPCVGPGHTKVPCNTHPCIGNIIISI